MAPLTVLVRRGGVVESSHEVHAVAVEGGAVVSEHGDPHLVCHLRSSAKPIQALELVRARPDLADEDIAIASASHQGEPAQVAAVGLLLEQAGAAPELLENGPQAGRPPEPIYHNCSGKHAGMLAVCLARRWPVEGYRLADHPLHRAILRDVAELSEVPEEEIPIGIDGCAAVTFALPLERMAYAFSRLEGTAEGARVAVAMRAHPELVGGRGADDTELMQSLPGWFAKRGAEGLFCAAGPGGTAIAVKVRDGSTRALRPAIASLLSELGHPLEAFRRVECRNSRGESVGIIELAP